MHEFIVPIEKYFFSKANTEKALGMKKYMRNQFSYFGISMPERRKFCTTYIKANQLKTIEEVEEIVKELWQLPEREFQYCATDILIFYKKIYRIQTIKLIEYCIIKKSWWDTVDFLSSQISKAYFENFSDKINFTTSQWNQSNNIWLQRSSLLFQLKSKSEINTELLYNFISNLI